MLTRYILLIYFFSSCFSGSNLLGQPTPYDAIVSLDDAPGIRSLRGDWEIVEDPTAVGGTSLLTNGKWGPPEIKFEPYQTGMVVFKARATGERKLFLQANGQNVFLKTPPRRTDVIEAEWTEYKFRIGSQTILQATSSEDGIVSGLLLDDFSLHTGIDVFVDEPEMGTVNVTPNKIVYEAEEAVRIEAIPDPGHRFYRWEGNQYTSQPLSSNPITLSIKWHTNISPVYLLPVPMIGGNAFIESIWDPSPAYDENFGGEAVLNDFLAVEVEGPGLLFFDIMPDDSNHVHAVFSDNQCGLHETFKYESPSDSGVKRFAYHVTQDGPVTVNIRLNKPSLVAGIEFSHGEVLQIEANGEGVVHITPNKLTYEIGEPVTLNAQPADGWVFDGWTGDVASDNDTLAIPADSDLEIVANFIIQGSNPATQSAIAPTISTAPNAETQLSQLNTINSIFQNPKQGQIDFELPDSGLPIGNLAWMRSNISKIAETQPMLEDWTSSVTGTNNDQFNFTSPEYPWSEGVKMISFSVNGPGILHMLPAFIESGPEWEDNETSGSFQVFMDGELVYRGANWIAGSSIVDVNIDNGSHIVVVVGTPYRIDAFKPNGPDFKFGVQGVTYNTGYRLDVSSNAGTITANPESLIVRAGRNVTVSTSSTTYANRFQGWSGDFNGTQNSITVQMNDHSQLRAEYAGPTEFSGLPASYGGDSLFAQTLSTNLQALGREGARSKSWVELKLGNQGYILDTKVLVRSEKENETLSFTIRLDGDIVYNRNFRVGNEYTNKVYIPPEAEVMRIEIEIPEGRNSIGTLSKFNLIKEVPVTYDFLTRTRFEVTPYKEMYAPGEIITYTLIDPAPPNSAIRLDLLSGDLEILPIANGPYAKEVQVRVISGGELRVGFITQKGDEMLAFEAPLTTDRVLKGNDAFLVQDKWLTARGPSVVNAWIWVPAGAEATLAPRRHPFREFGIESERELIVRGSGDWQQVSITTEEGDDGILITGSSSEIVMDEIVVQSGYGFNFIASGGSITIDPNSVAHEKRKLVTLTTIPNAGYTFSGWNDSFHRAKSQIRLRAGISQELRPHFNKPVQISGQSYNVEGAAPDLQENYSSIFISNETKGITRISKKIMGPAVFNFVCFLYQQEPRTDRLQVELNGISYTQAREGSELIEVQIPDGEHEVAFWYKNGGSMTGTIYNFETTPGYSVFFPEIDNTSNSMIVSPARVGLRSGQEVEFEPKHSYEEFTNSTYQKNGSGKYTLTATKHYSIAGDLINKSFICSQYHAFPITIDSLGPKVVRVTSIPSSDRISPTWNGKTLTHLFGVNEYNFNIPAGRGIFNLVQSSTATKVKVYEGFGIEFTDRSLISKIEPDQPAYLPGTKVIITPIDLSGTEWEWTGDASGQATPLVVIVDKPLKIGLSSTRPLETPGFEARTGYQPWTVQPNSLTINSPTGLGTTNSFVEVDIMGPAKLSMYLNGDIKIEIGDVTVTGKGNGLRSFQIGAGKHIVRFSGEGSLSPLQVTPLFIESYQTWLGAWTKTYYDSVVNEFESDRDGDGISNRAEFLAGTSPIESNPLVRMEFREFEGTPQLCLVIQDLKVHELATVLCYFSEEGLSDAFVRRHNILDTISQTYLNAEGTSELVAPVSQFDDNWIGFQISYYRLFD